MLLTISAAGAQGSNLSFLLHKHPDRFQTFELSFGQAHVFYPLVSDDGVKVCLLLEVDPIGMAKKNRGSHGPLDGYVNDRPFVTSSFMSTAIASVFGSAMAGRCKDRPEATGLPLDFIVQIESLPVRGGESFLRNLFEPLGYTVRATSHELDQQFPQWGTSPYLSVELKTTCTLAEMLSHLYVLIPVFDDQKHYFVGTDEIQKLLDKGSGWLADHPAKDVIVRRYLRHQTGLVRRALTGLNINDDGLELAEQELDPNADQPPIETELDRQLSLNQLRHQTVIDQMVASSATRVIDLGCGEGKLLRRLLAQKQFREIVGMDVSSRALELAARRMRLDSLPAAQAQRVRLLHGSLMYRDQRLHGFDAACLVEVIEHLDPPRLAAMQRVVFQYARPKTVIVTTPNLEYNVVWETLPAGAFRHGDHRFEWTRTEFQTWADDIANMYGYQVHFEGIGPEVAEIGTPTQMAVFSLDANQATDHDHAK